MHQRRTAQPHFILRDLWVEQFRYVDALREHETALRLVPDTTDRDLIELGVLTLAATSSEYEYYETSLGRSGEFESALTATEAGLALRAPGRMPYAAAGGVFMARGMPNEAIELLGASRPLLKRIRILGSNGAPANRLRHALESLGALWAAEYDGEELGLLACGQAASVAGALVYLGPEAAAWWLGRFPDPVPERCRNDGTVEALELLAGIESADSSTRAADVEAAVTRLDDHFALPLPVTLYTLADIARRLERDDLAVELYSRMDVIAYDVLPRGRSGIRGPARSEIGGRGQDPMGYDFGLLSLSYLHRARSYEALGQTVRARIYYQRFADIWSEAEPDLQHYALEAQSRLDQLRAYAPSG